LRGALEKAAGFIQEQKDILDFARLYPNKLISEIDLLLKGE
jgi:hypothetical protein